MSGETAAARWFALRTVVCAMGVAASMLLAACGSANFATMLAPSWAKIDGWIAFRYGDVKAVTTTELSNALNGDAPLMLLDVRETSEFAVSRIPGARHVVPASVADFAKRELAAVDRAQPIYVYCSVGVRSAAAAHELQTLGFTRVRNVRGSLFKWANEGRALEGGARVHAYDAPWAQLLREDLRAPLSP